jgi:hypothetical protein
MTSRFSFCDLGTTLIGFFHLITIEKTDSIEDFRIGKGVSGALQKIPFCGVKEKAK